MIGEWQSMTTKRRFEPYSGFQVSSDIVADELYRRGVNKKNQYLLDKMIFIAGRLPRSSATVDDLYLAVSEALLMRRDMEEEIVSMAIGAFSEARYHLHA